jgi:hypothetical protein
LEFNSFALQRTAASLHFDENMRAASSNFPQQHLDEKQAFKLTNLWVN